MNEKERQIAVLKQNNVCWNFFEVQRDHVLDSTEAIRKVINNINKRGYSELSNLITISDALDTIENQMPTTT